MRILRTLSNPNNMEPMMATKLHKIEIFKDKKNEYRWRLYSPNGRIMADSGEGYTRRDNLNRAIAGFKTAFSAKDLEVVEVL